MTIAGWLHGDVGPYIDTGLCVGSGIVGGTGVDPAITGEPPEETGRNIRRYQPKQPRLDPDG
jgi:hypothetical protein